MGDVAHAQADEIAIAQLAVYGQVEHSEVTNRMPVLQVYPDSPDALGLERRLLADELSLVPGFAFLSGFHIRLLRG